MAFLGFWINSEGTTPLPLEVKIILLHSKLIWKVSKKNFSKVHGRYEAGTDKRVKQ